MSDFKQKFGTRLKELRKANNLSQEHLAELINITPRNLSKIETGQAFPSSTKLEKILSALNIDAKKLFDFEHHKAPDDLKEEICLCLSNLSVERLQDIYKIIKALIE